MLRTDIVDSLQAECGEDGYLFPDYESYSFANVPHTLASVLGADTGRTLPDDALAGVDAKGIETVLVVLVDGFGFEQWRCERDHHPFLDELSGAARVTPLTSVYPSETAAAMTTFHTGTLPAEHGVVGWNVYEPTVGAEFEALPFQTKDGDPPAGLDPADVADATPLYSELADAGVSSHLLTPFETFAADATHHTYESLDEFPEGIRGMLGAAWADDARSYCFAYVPHVDTAAHESGTESITYRETVGDVFETLSNSVSDLDAETAEDTLLVVTADHGHVNTDPERNVNLDRWDAVVDALHRRDDGAPVKFSGSPRNVHLHLRDEEAEDVAATLREEFGTDAQVFEQAEIFERELFGDVTPSETFRRRLGDVVVSHRNLSVWYGDEEPDEMELVGMHGGLNPDEMLIPFAACRMDELTR